MNKRERTIGIVLGAVVGIWALDSLVVEPLMESLNQVNTDIAMANDEYDKETRMINNRARYDQMWSENIVRGIKDDASTAQAQLTENVVGWVQQSGLNFRNVTTSSPVLVGKLGGKPGERQKGFMRQSARINASGRMNQIAQLVQSIQHASIPIRINDMNIASEKENQDDLQVTMQVSTIFIVPDNLRPGEAPPSSRPAMAQAQQGRGSATAPITGQSPQRENR
ncbi:MAG TPA: hypothetical protein VHD56_06040 [Tepidisphaeraceae bacterium]|nr:hypothetical protein [Tepidisphaeraceae bacterium]